MNLTKRVWLPPDGDSRLLRVQATHPLAPQGPPALPPYLELTRTTEAPRGPVVLGNWVNEAEGMALEAFDSTGFIGLVRLGWPPLGSDPRLWPPPPSLQWTRGRLAILEISRPSGDDTFILWSWRQIRGWKSDLPKE